MREGHKNLIPLKFVKSEHFSFYYELRFASVSQRTKCENIIIPYQYKLLS